jgi:hypothetical protein
MKSKCEKERKERGKQRAMRNAIATLTGFRQWRTVCEFVVCNIGSGVLMPVTVKGVGL